MASKKKNKTQASRVSTRKRQTTLKFINTSGGKKGSGGDVAEAFSSTVHNAAATGKCSDGVASSSVDQAKRSTATTKASAGVKAAAPIASLPSSSTAVGGNREVCGDTSQISFDNNTPRRNPNFAVVIDVCKSRAELDENTKVDEGDGDGEDKESGGEVDDDEPVWGSTRKKDRGEGLSGSGEKGGDEDKGGAGSRHRGNQQNTPTKKRNGGQGSEDVVSSDDESIITPAAKKKQKLNLDRSSSLRKGKNKIVESEGSDLELPTPKKKKNVISLDEDESDFTPKKRILSEDDENEPTLKKSPLENDKSDFTPKKKLKKLTKILSEDESDLELLRAPGTNTLPEESNSDPELPTLPRDVQDEEDIKEDMELASENGGCVVIQTRYYGLLIMIVVLDRRDRKGGFSKKVSVRRKFANLRAKRDQRTGIAGSATAQPSTSPAPTSPAPTSSAPTSSAPTSPAPTSPAPISPAPTSSTAGDGDGPDSISDDEDLNNDLENFIVEDNPDDLIGAPDIAVPLEFTSAAHESNSEQFRLYMEFLVSEALFPNTFAKGAVENNAIRRLETVAASFGNSVIQSGAWTASFARALKARPTLVAGSCLKSDHCDACNRNNQHAALTVQFTGRRYDKDTLYDLSSDEDEESTDEHGEELFPEDKVFKLGRMCHTRALSAHTLFHWKKELKGWIEEHLKSTGYIDDDGDLVNRTMADSSIEGKLIFLLFQRCWLKWNPRRRQIRKSTSRVSIRNFATTSRTSTATSNVA